MTILQDFPTSILKDMTTHNPLRPITRATLCVLLFSFIVPFLTGCVSEPSRNYKKDFVNTYAELTLLYEKEKMQKRQTDSAYQVTVQQFFDRKGLKQADFKGAVEQLSGNEKVWKLFIQDVTAAMDSLRALK